MATPPLTPERIAREHFISTRQLYYLWSGQDENLSEWIIQRRLDTAHLALTSNIDTKVADVARTCGFVNTPHFNRRYRLRFGEKPRDTQAKAHARIVNNQIPPDRPTCRRRAPRTETRIVSTSVPPTPAPCYPP